jgi:hypothetical protein
MLPSAPLRDPSDAITLPSVHNVAANPENGVVLPPIQPLAQERELFSDDDLLPSRIASAKRKGRSKKKDIDQVPDSPPAAKPKKSRPAKKDTVAEPKTGKGRQPGSVGYSVPECEALLDCIEDYLPIGGAGWSAVSSKYNSWTSKHGYVERTEKALRVKYDVVRIYTRHI